VLTLEGGVASLAVAKGTTVPLVFRAYQLDSEGNKKPVRNVVCELKSEAFGFVELSEDMQLRARETGRTSVWLVDPESGTESNRVDLEVAECTGAEVRSAPERLLYQGERVTLRVVFETGSGSRSDLLIEGSVDEPTMGRINRHGAFTAGGVEGTATVRLRYGSGAEQTVTQQLRIGPDRMPHAGKSGQDSGDLPLILVCGTAVPGMENYPPDQRTIEAAEHFPTVIDYEPQFENVIFINPDSREATQVRKGKGGRRGPMSIGTETFLQFLALKMFEIVKRLYVRQSVKDTPITEMEFRNLFATAETQCANFIDKAYTLARELASDAEGGR
jgi:hypothetical protein